MEHSTVPHSLCFPLLLLLQDEDVRVVEATATMAAGALYTVPCRLDSVAPFPPFQQALAAAVEQATRLRWVGYEMVHRTLMEVSRLRLCMGLLVNGKIVG